MTNLTSGPLRGLTTRRSAMIKQIRKHSQRKAERRQSRRGNVPRPGSYWKRIHPAWYTTCHELLLECNDCPLAQSKGFRPMNLSSVPVDALMQHPFEEPPQLVCDGQGFREETSQHKIILLNGSQRVERGWFALRAGELLIWAFLGRKSGISPAHRAGTQWNLHVVPCGHNLQVVRH